jgi:RNA polymerase primary sigma factor
MGRDLRQEALTYLLEKADKQGYVTFDDIMNCADANSLPIQDFDWLSSSITTRGILVYDEAPITSNRISQDSEEDDYTDYAQSDYEYVYDKIIEMDDTLRDFVNEVRNIKPPQWKEFSQLKYQVTEGNFHARERMIEMHLRIALRIALQRTETYDMDIQDAIGEACIGLVMAVDKYNPDTNGAFGSYAAMWILQNISRRQPTQRALMYYPVHKKDSYFSAYPLLKQEGCAGDIEAINDQEVYSLLMERFAFTIEQAEDVILSTIPFESYEELYGMYFDTFDGFEEREEQQTNVDVYPRELSCEDNIEEKVTDIMMHEHLLEVLGTLSDREQLVLELRYGLKGDAPKTLEEVGMEFNITRERVRQIEAKALRKLRHPSRSRKLRDYIDYTPTVKGEDE